MASKAARASAAATAKHVEQRVAQTLSPLLWRERHARRRLGLAISGGVDSMALATLCRNIDGPKDAFTGFIVDHGLRSNSRDEAAAVAEELKRFGIRPHILRLNWKAHASPTSLGNVETVARRLRYQELGRACFEEGIRNLLVAHHADDQAETVLMRILTGYLGTGLQAIQGRARIPYCNDIYGAGASGEPAVRADLVSLSGEITKRAGVFIENGGVNILRPLLPFTKDQLLAVCREAGTKWYEDTTNSDKSLTVRNTIRYLQAQRVLPAAFNRKCLCAMADVQAAKNERINNQAQAMFRSLEIKLDMRCGAATIKVKQPLTVAVTTKGEGYHVKAALLRKLLALVSPLTDISLHDLDLPVDLLFPTEGHVYLNQVTIANVSIEHNTVHADGALERHFVFHRQPPGKHVLKKLDLGTSDFYDRDKAIFWTQWRLWDGRYWIRVGSSGAGIPRQDVRHSVGFLSKESLTDLRKSFGEKEPELEKLLDGASGKIRYTLPALFCTEQDHEEIVALPTLRWRHPKWHCDGLGGMRNGKKGWIFEVRYKHIDYGETKEHIVLS